MSASLAAFLYLVSGALFIMALRGLSSPVTSRQGNLFGMIGMGLAIVTTLLLAAPASGLAWALIIGGIAIGGAIGAVTAKRIAMTAMPQLVAAFHSLVGLAAVFVAAAAYYAPEAFGIASNGEIHAQSRIEMALGAAIGALTFTGSIIAFLKLDGRMSGKPIILPGRHFINIALAVALVVFIYVFFASQSALSFWLIVAISLALGFLLIVPIGGADMPVVISMLNSYSGWAAAGIGFTLANTALIITGALVGSSGAILSYIMCKGMNRSFFSVILGGFGGETTAAAGGAEARPVKQGSADDAAFIMKNAGSVIIVPGYGMAVAQAQHALREMADHLKKAGVTVKYAIHPVAGRMPGHMNVLLAEANVPYDEVFELEDINSEFAQSDVAFVIGANDVTNPAAKDDPASPIYGMPVLEVWKANTVMFIKRGMSSGYAGIDNGLFYRDNTMMLFGDAKKMTEEIVKGHVRRPVALDFARDGVAVRDAVVGADILRKLAEEFEEAGVRIGARPFALSPVIRELLAPSGILTLLAGQWAGVPSRPVRVLAFDKTPDANWHLPWHQDRVIAVRNRADVPGFGNWTIKNGQHHVEAPAELLATMFNLRLHIDDCDAANGALKVVPGSHGRGRLTDAEVRDTARQERAITCPVAAGGVLAMKALTIHASDASSTPRRRRVLHVDYCGGALPKGLDWALDV